MKVCLIGKRLVDFTAEDGRRICGASIYIGYEDNDVEGMVVDKVFVSSEKVALNDLKVGADLDIEFNNKGRVIAVSAV